MKDKPTITSALALEYHRDVCHELESCIPILGRWGKFTKMLFSVCLFLN